ncbi:hypothetical protein Efla_001678 [Eimeria flavescens]
MPRQHRVSASPRDLNRGREGDRTHPSEISMEANRPSIITLMMTGLGGPPPPSGLKLECRGPRDPRGSRPGLSLDLKEVVSVQLDDCAEGLRFRLFTNEAQLCRLRQQQSDNLLQVGQANESLCSLTVCELKVTSPGGASNNLRKTER